MSATEVNPRSAPIHSAQTPGANRNYPFNCWWVAATADKVTKRPLCRWLLEQRVVLFRTEDGAVAALADRCAHRWAPLSQGKVIGEEIVCPYHGFRYSTAGTCTHIPVLSHTPPKMKVRSYPVREHGSFVWIWMGDPARADPALLPDIPWFTDPGYLQVRLYMEFTCNYMLVQENVLDLTHIAHLHADTLQQANTLQMEGWRVPRAEVKVTDRSVTVVHTFSDMPLGPPEAGKKVKRLVFWGSFASPACHVSGGDFEDPVPANGMRARYNSRSLHCTTPISPDRCHYWWANADDFDHLPNRAEWGTSLLEAIKPVFKQDQSVLEAIQMTIDRDRRPDNARENLVVSDRAPVEARRILKKMLEAESP